MRRMTMGILALALVATLTLTGCKEKLKQSRGIVAAMEMSGDTLLNMRVAVQGDDTLVFKLDDANFNRGIAMHGDSVLVNHLSGPGDTLRAIIVTVMPPPGALLHPRQRVEGAAHRACRNDKVEVKILT